MSSALDEMLEGFSRCLSSQSACRLTELQVAALVQARIDSFARMANEGTLTCDERLEYEALINAADFISILKLKARRHLIQEHNREV